MFDWFHLISLYVQLSITQGSISNRNNYIRHEMYYANLMYEAYCEATLRASSGCDVSTINLV